MGWLIGIYVVIGLFKSFGKLASDNPTSKPVWMLTEKNPLMWSLYFVFYVLAWPLVRR